MTTNEAFPSRFVFRLFILLIIGSVFFSCKTGDNLADQGIIQKRKYQKGYHVNVKTPFKSKDENLNQDDISDRPFTASVKAEVITKSKEAELQHSNAESSDLTLAEKNPSPKSDLIIKERELDDNIEASISSAPDLKFKSVFQNNLFVNESVKHSNTSSSDPDYYSARRLNTLALLSFIFGVLSLFILGLPFGVVAVVCGIIAIVQIENKPDVYKGKTLAIIGLIIGIIAVVVMIAFLSTEV